MQAHLASGMLLIAVLATACSRSHKSSVADAGGGGGDGGGDSLGVDAASSDVDATSTGGSVLGTAGGVESTTGNAGASENGSAGGSENGSAGGNTVTSGGVTGTETISGAGGASTTGTGGVGTTGTDEDTSGANTATTGGTGGGAAPSTGSGGTSSSSTGGSGGGAMTCETGMVLGSEVLVIGDSFIAITPDITGEVERLARAADAIDESESYRDEAISGARLAGGASSSIPNQYTNAVSEGPVKVVLMDGGATDCQNGEPAAALAAAEALFETMQQNGTEQVVYFFYPDPSGGLMETLKPCFDELRPQMQALCEGLTAPKCYWLDLRESWDGHPEYTSDGLHPTNAGSLATGQAIWEVMVENCVAQ